MKKIIAAGGLVFNKNDDLLMIFRRGFWDLPKGKLDEGESIEQCAVREVEEETGLRNIEVEKLVGITKHEYFDEYSNREVVKESHWYKMRIQDEQKLIPQTEEDILDIKWIPQNDLKKYLEKSYSTITAIVNKLKETQ